MMLSMMMVLVPAAGAQGEELLQDTLKSLITVTLTLAATFSFFYRSRKNISVVNWHWILALPIGLMAYALASMIWSHTYLAGVETVRWFFFSTILFLGLNVLTQRNVTHLVWCIHLGAVVASLWAALQFWFNWQYFAQGPNPASTFVNRNFFSEFVLCTLPYSLLLLTRVKDKISVYLLAFSLAFNVVGLLMAGTRSALLGLLLIALFLPIFVLSLRRHWASSGWTLTQCAGLSTLFFATVIFLGSLPTGNPKLMHETGAGNALDRAFARVSSISEAKEYKTGSFSVRAQMWSATMRMIADHPMSGVGAGAWEVHIPKYQDNNTALETDFYAHNEPLQLLAEYGIGGWIFLLFIWSYLIWAAYVTWQRAGQRSNQETPIRVFCLTSLIALMLVSTAGFPWRLASTGAIFALSLAVLAASDLRLFAGRRRMGGQFAVTSVCSLAVLCATAICTGVTIYVAQQAIACEDRLVRAAKISLTISASGNVKDPRWDPEKKQMLQLLQEGIAINPHYRKLTPIAADALASWGDWRNATWVWESVLLSRPYIVGLLANITRGHIQAKQFDVAQKTLNRALEIQPSNQVLGSLQTMIWSLTGQPERAMQRANSLLTAKYIDLELLQVAYALGTRQRQPSLAIAALELGIQTWPNRAVDGWLKLGDIYASEDALDTVKAQHAFQTAMNLALPTYKQATLQRVPKTYQLLLQ